MAHIDNKNTTNQTNDKGFFGYIKQGLKVPFIKNNIAVGAICVLAIGCVLGGIGIWGGVAETAASSVKLLNAGGSALLGIGGGFVVAGLGVLVFGDRDASFSDPCVPPGKQEKIKGLKNKLGFTLGLVTTCTTYVALGVGLMFGGEDLSQKAYIKHKEQIKGKCLNENVTEDPITGIPNLPCECGPFKDNVKKKFDGASKITVIINDKKQEVESVKVEKTDYFPTKKTLPENTFGAVYK